MPSDRADPVARSTALLAAVASVGRKFPASPQASLVDPFRPYFDSRTKNLFVSELDRRDGGVTRREAILRFLLLSAVVDQGPDIEGVRDLVVRVVNDLYSREVRLFHRPGDFFQHFGIAVDSIESMHEIVKALHAARWAESNRSLASKYLLYMENAKQTLGYAVYRWGAPLALAHLLHQQAESEGRDPSDALLQYLREQHGGFPPSTEGVTKRIKDHPKLGLGKAIGDKAAHLFGKWAIHAYPLLTRADDPAWDAWSYEVPFDSNAGRVLYRTGFLTTWLDDKVMRRAQVLQAGKGKEAGTDHMRVTNLRGLASAAAAVNPFLVDTNTKLCVNHLRTHRKRPTKVEIQRLPSILSLRSRRTFTLGQIDDGLIKIGTTWCFNTAAPDCAHCPVRTHCAGATRQPALITKVRT